MPDHDALHAPLPLYLGCAVWAYRGFLGEFYPAGSKPSEFLKLYTERLTAIEANTTFYALPKLEVLKSWRESLPEPFAFCPKLARAITHEGGSLLEHERATEAFLRRMSALGSRLGPVLMQLPPSFAPARLMELERYLRRWPRAFEMALEVRHIQWWEPEHAAALNELLSELNVARVLLDTRPVYQSEDDPQQGCRMVKPRLPVDPIVTADFTLVRLITHPRAEATDAYLDQWADQCADWIREGTRVYFFMHCPIEERSPGYARDFYSRLKARTEDLPDLPWRSVKPPPKQLALF